MFSTSSMANRAAAFLFVLLIAPTAYGKNCGDTSGARGRDVKCDCGDTVTTNTILKNNDRARRAVCPAAGLVVAAGVTLDLNRGALVGNGTGVGLTPRAGATVRNGFVRGFATGILVEDGTVVLTDIAADANAGSGLVVNPSSGASPVVTFNGVLASVSDNGSNGIVIQAGAELDISGDSANAKLPVLRNAGSGIVARGALLATAVKVGESADHGVLVESAEPVEFVDSQVNDSGRHPDGDVAGRIGVRVLSAPNGFNWHGVNSVVRDNTGHGFALGHATDQSGHVVGMIFDSQIYVNDIGINVEQKDETTARTTSTIVDNNIYANRGSGVHVKTSYQGSTLQSPGLPFSANLVHRNAVLPAEMNVCTQAAGASQSAAQIVVDGPIATTDLDFEPAVGPDPDAFPDDHACYFGPESIGTPIDSEEACHALNTLTGQFGIVSHHCIWNGTQCRVAWDFGGPEVSSPNAIPCSLRSNSIWNYVNDPTKAETTQKGIAALNGAMVRARRNEWGSGGSVDGIAEDSGQGSEIEAGDQCPGTETICVGYDQVPRN